MRDGGEITNRVAVRRATARRRGVRLAALVALLLILGGVGLRPRPAAAHPLGNFTANQYVRIEAEPDGIRLVYVLDLAEIPTFQEIGERIDADGDGTIAEGERQRYLDAKIAELLPALRLTSDGAAVPLTVVAARVDFPDGQAGLRLLRLEATFAAPVAVGETGRAEIAFALDYATDRLGWREVVVTHGAGVRLENTDAPATDASDELRRYPDDLLGNPLDRTSATFTLAADPGAAAAPGWAAFREGSDAAAAGERPGGGTAGDRFAALLDGEDLTPAGILLALALALGWGAVHALSPGHGKTVVGAYLVGARGTPRHALYLGLTVTLTHTAGVVTLGLVTLLLSRYILPEQLYPWMSLASGLLVVGMGLVLVRQRLTGGGPFGHHHPDGADGHHHHHHGDESHTHAAHAHGNEHEHEHDHGHSHLPPERVTGRSLLALGISGGLVPCPSALVVLLGSIALGRVGFGLLLVVAFSLGLAAALTAIGLLFLTAGRYLERRMTAGGGLVGLALRYAPVAGAVGVTLAGLVIVARALDQTRIV